jgi:hypothetical protein
MLRPWVEVRERYSGMLSSGIEVGRLSYNFARDASMDRVFVAGQK